MGTLPPETLALARDAFKTCGPFDSNLDLLAVFEDARLAPWREDVPLAGNRLDRIDALIAWLLEDTSAQDEQETSCPHHALVLFTRVCAEHAGRDDACYDQLQAVAQRLAEASTEAQKTADDRDRTVRYGPSLADIVASTLLDQLNLIQLRAIRVYRGFAIGLVLLGMVVAVLGWTLPARMMPASLHSWIGLGGLFIASLSVLQFHEMLNCREKVALLSSIKNTLVGQLHSPGTTAEDAQIEARAWQVIEKTAVT